ncbi:hypothetical protein IWX46DRAFT_136670 [Phyllosticta citricarpa]|uniref:Uncharacterized protein n=1 Tax=Phyllosticta citricarpa TaxID=55181 RepID=A0ABR1MPR7_9PEZI
MFLSRRRRCNFSDGSPGPIPDLPTVQKSHRRLARHFQYECECEWSGVEWSGVQLLCSARCTPGSRWSSFARPLPSLRRATSKTAALPNDARPPVCPVPRRRFDRAGLYITHNMTSLTSCSANLANCFAPRPQLNMNSIANLCIHLATRSPALPRAARRSSVSYPPTHPPCALPDLTLRIRPWQPTLNKLAQETLPSLTILTAPKYVTLCPNSAKMRSFSSPWPRAIDPPTFFFFFFFLGLIPPLNPCYVGRRREKKYRETKR